MFNPYEDDVVDESRQGVAVAASGEVVAPWLAAKSEDEVRKALETRASAYAAAVQAYVVTDLEAAHVFLKQIRADRNAWNALWAPHLEGALQAKRIAEANRKRVVADIERLDGPLLKCENALDDKIIAAEKVALEAAEEERKRLQPLATAEHEEKLIGTALALYEEAGQQTIPEVREALIEEAESILENPEPAPIVEAKPVIPTGTGISRPKRYKASITSLNELLTALINKKLDAPLTADLMKRISEAVMPPLNQRASALKSAMNIPGVRAEEITGRQIRG